MRKFATWHPFLFAVFPILALQATNLSEIPSSDGSRALALSLGASLLLLVSFRLLLRDWDKAGLLVSFLLVLFFSYGHLYLLLSRQEIAGFIIARHRYFLLGSLLSLGIWAYLVYRVARPRNLNGMFNVIGLVAVAFPLARLGVHQYRERLQPALEASQAPLGQGGQGVSPNKALPDIFYIVLDGYARADVLKELYSYDNSAFTSFLEERGFFVAEGARSNYNQTVLSISSALNMDYVDQFQESLGVAPQGRGGVADLLKEAQLLKFLSSQGYEIVGFPTGYAHTDLLNADLYLRPEEDVVEESLFSLRFNRLEGLLLETTAARVLLDTQVLKKLILGEKVLGAEYSLHRQRVLHALRSLPEIAEKEGPQFVFAHVIAPHPPFVFGANGEEIPQGGAYSLADGNWYGGPQPYIDGYRDQLTFLNKMLRWSIDEILFRSESPTIILLQADHGPGAYMVWESPAETNMTERLAILSAYYFSDRDYEALYASISPVNSFRIVLNEYFDGDLALLEDESYFSTWDDPLNYLRVTDQLEPAP